MLEDGLDSTNLVEFKTPLPNSQEGIPAAGGDPSPAASTLQLAQINVFPTWCTGKTTSPVHHELTLPVLYQLSVCASLSAAGTMPFGKNNKLTMPRAQKTIRSRRARMRGRSMITRA